MIEEVKQYGRIDEGEGDSLLVSLIEAAKIYIKNATDKPMDENNELYNLAVEMLVTHWNENREVVGKADKLAFGLASILQQIEFCGDDV